MKAVRFVSLLGVICVMLALESGAAPITSGNILISTEEVLYEYTPGGIFVQSFPIPYPTGPHPLTESARDIAMKQGSTAVHVFNGTFSPYLSTLDTSTSLWTHQTVAGWSTENNGSYGGIAVGGNYVFVMDMDTVGNTEKGVVRFDSGGGTIRFATSIDPRDVNVGNDGLLYALEFGRFVYVYDADSFALQQSLDLYSTIAAADYRSIAANAAGQLFIVDFSGNLYKTDSNGNVILSTSLSGIAASTNLGDVDVSDSGMVVVGDRSGGVTVTDENFTSPYSFSVGSSNVFVAVEANPPVGVPVSPVAVGVLAGLLMVVSLATFRRLRLFSQTH